MRKQDEFASLNKEKNTGNKVFVLLFVLAIFAVGIGCYGKMQQDNATITLTSQAVTGEVAKG